MQTEVRSLADRCHNIELLLLDVDGVLTGGEIALYDDQGGQLKVFHVRDGTGLKCWRQAGKQTAIVSGRTARSVKHRARELGIELVFEGVPDKLVAYHELLNKTGFSSPQVCAIGDDLADLPVAQESGLAIGVADACPEILRAAHFITCAPGGKGAVREAIELILKCEGRWIVSR